MTNSSDKITATRRIIADGLTFGEGPRWHDGSLWVSDMLANEILRIELDGRMQRVAEVSGSPSGLGWLPDGRMLAVSMVDGVVLAIADGQSEVYADLNSISGGTPNDMIVDSQGRAYVGNAGCNLFEGLNPNPTNLILVDNGKVSQVADGLVFPNGMAISPDGNTLFVAETFAHKVTAFTIAVDGSLSDRRAFAELPNRTPDGICLDAEGAVWVCSAETSEVLRVSDGGAISECIDLGGRFAAACVTGGENRCTLLVVSSDTTPEKFMRGESTCRIEAYNIDIPGVGAP